MYGSSITFLYYDDFDKATDFFESILKLELVMNQGFARIYKTGKSGFLGIVRRSEASIEYDSRAGVLISLNTSDVEEEYKKISKLNVRDLSEIKYFENIPLKSFFFKDHEGYNFEIQQFMKKEDLKIFN